MMMMIMTMIFSDLVYILKMIGPNGTLSDDDDDIDDDDHDGDDGGAANGDYCDDSVAGDFCDDDNLSLGHLPFLH